MIVDGKWLERNIGFDALTQIAPLNTYAVKAAATFSPRSVDLQREIIDFDSEAPVGKEFLAFTTATGLSRFTDIPWPDKSLAPKTDAKARKGSRGALPKADVLVVTWTVDEGHALSRVLTPGKDSHNDYVSYTHNFNTISKEMAAGCPAREANRLGAYWTGTIGREGILIFKSDSHMSQDGPKLPNETVWKQIIREVQPKLVITTGTAGGIGKHFEVGDVVVSPLVKFDCKRTFKRLNGQHFSSVKPNTKYFAIAKRLFKANSGQLPRDNSRPPAITQVAPSQLRSGVLTTDFFGFDTTNNFYKLQHDGDVSEMGDAVLGLVAKKMGASAPRWVAVRNVSDPQIKAQGTIQQQAQAGALIYKAFGRWSSVCSAIVCWALIAAEQ